MRSFKKIYSISVVLTLMASFILTGCSTPKPTQSMGASVNGYKGAPAKYVFYFIGDGMGLTQINSAEIFLGSTSTKASSEPIKLNFNICRRLLYPRLSLCRNCPCLRLQNQRRCRQHGPC